MSRRRTERPDPVLRKLSDFRASQAAEKKLQRIPTTRRRRARALVKRTPCGCGSGQAPTMCHGCTITLDLATLERRTTDDGREQVRISGNITWGKVPPRMAGAALVCPDLVSEWLDSDSEDGRRLLAATLPSRAARRLRRYGV